MSGGALSQPLFSVRALLLNSSYEPMRVVSWQKALVLWFQGKVEILEYHTVFARSVSASFKLPSVLRLKSYVRSRAKTHIRFCRENVYIRDNYTCQYCATRLSTKSLTLDHVLPVSREGKKDWSNVVSACRSCNQKKANKTPSEARMPLLKEPRMPNWLPLTEFEAGGVDVPQAWRQYLRSAQA